MEKMKEFVAYSKKLLRVLKKIKKALKEKEYEEAEKLIDELKAISRHKQKNHQLTISKGQRQG